MKIFSNNFKIIIFTFASILLGIFLWDKINLPYSNPENIYGVLSINKFNPINNDLRFLTFITLIFGVFSLSLIFYKKNCRIIESLLAPRLLLIVLCSTFYWHSFQY